MAVNEKCKYLPLSKLKRSVGLGGRLTTSRYYPDRYCMKDHDILSMRDCCKDCPDFEPK